MRKLLLVLFISLCFSSFGFAASRTYTKGTLVGGVAGCLDAIDGAILSDGDRAIVISTAQTYDYYLDADSGLAESVPDVVKPDVNYGTKRWVLRHPIGVADNTTNIATNTTDIATNVADIATNVTDIASNTAGISSNVTDIASNTAGIAANVIDIAGNVSDIADNVTSIATNTANITTNTDNITTNISDISGNTTNITNNTANIATNVSNIDTNTGNILSNTNDIATNITNIATNTAAISPNTDNIAINVTNIATNVSNIDTNTSGLAATVAATTPNTAFRVTPSTVITAGDQINWDGNTLNVPREVYVFGVLTGGGSTALDGIDGADLSAGDRAIVITDDYTYNYFLDSSSGLDEYVPYVISPDANAGTKRWELKESRLFELPDYSVADQGVTDDNNTIKYYIDSAGGNLANIHLRHNSGGTTTEYIFLTSEVIPDNITFIIDSGAMIKVAAGVTVSDVKNIDAGNYQVFTGTGDIDFLDGTEILVSWCGTLAGALNWIETEEVSLKVTDDITVDTAETILSNITLKREPGAIINGVGTITFSEGAKFITDNSQAFGSSITILGFTNLAFANPDWWGNTTPGTTDMTVGLQKCITASGNRVPILIHRQLLITDQITLPSTGGAIKSITNSAYFASGTRGRYHIIVDKNDVSKAVFYLANDEKCTWLFRDLNIDMQDSTIKAFMNEAAAGSGSGRFNIQNLLIDNCGGDGIVINDGGNTLLINNLNISGISSASTIDGSGIVVGSIGIGLYAADCRVINTELKGGFDIGLKITNNTSNFTNNFFDQNNINVVDAGRSNRWVGNRFQYGYDYGMQLGNAASPCVNPTLVGNVFRYNNSSKTLTTGFYDGVGLYCYDLNSGTITGNAFLSQDDGILMYDTAINTIMMGNTEYDLDSSLYDYSTGIGGSGVFVQDNTSFYKINGSSVIGSFSISSAGYLDLSGGMRSSTASSVGKANDFLMNANVSKSLKTDGNYMEVNCNAVGVTLTITDNDLYQMRGLLVIIVHDGSTDFTLAVATGSIVGTTAIVTGNKYTYFVDFHGNLIEF